MLSQTAEYALRAMGWLAIHGHEGPIPGKALSDATGVPSHYLSKIMRRMVVSGLLESRRGHHGGFVLTRPSAEITFYDVLDAVGSAPNSGSCAFGIGACDERHPCPLHHALFPLVSEYEAWARRTTLADVDGSVSGAWTNRLGA